MSGLIDNFMMVHKPVNVMLRSNRASGGAGGWPLSEDFSGDLSAWNPVYISGTKDFTIVSGKANYACNTGDDRTAMWHTTTAPGDDHEVAAELLFSGASPQHGIFARGDNDDTGYLAFVFYTNASTHGIYLFRYVNNGFTSISNDGSETPAAGAIYKLRVEGADQKVHKWTGSWTQKCTGSDSGISSGTYVGFWGRENGANGKNCTVDDWAAGTIDTL